MYPQTAAVSSLHLRALPATSMTVTAIGVTSGSECCRCLLLLQREQPVGTPGKDATWGGLPKWPGIAVFEQLATPKIMAGLAVNVTAVREWFVPRYAAWKADNRSVITLADVAELADDAAWTPAHP